jgi:hypothetical protein
MDVDESSKLWGMLHDTPYVLSVTYQAALVLVDGREQPRHVPQVRERNIRVNRAPREPATPSVNGGG